MDSNGIERSWWDEDFEELKNMIENSLMEEPSHFGDASNLNDVPPVPELDRQEVDPKPHIDSKSQGTVNERKRKRDSQPLSEKLKASSIQMNELIVGDWLRLTVREGDLTAKLYYNQRQLIWENLDAGQLKTKMVINWSDITAIHAVMLENQPGILQIELGKPPLFYREDPPKPRKQTSWHKIDDFTGGQALLHRRHFATFPSGFLDKHYENLLRCDERLFDLSQKPFPSQEERPYFVTDPSSNLSEPPNNFNEPMTQQYPPQFNYNGPTIRVNNLLGPMTHQQHPSKVNFNGPMTQQDPTQVNFNGPMTQQYPYPPPRAIAGNQFVPTPNMNGGAGNSQLMRQTVWDAEMMHFPTANPAFFTAGRMLLPVANPLPQPPPLRTNYQVVFQGQSYPFNNLVPPNSIGNHEMLRIAAPNMDEEIPRFAQMGPPFFADPDDNINHYQMSGDLDNRVVMLHNNGPSVRPVTRPPSPAQVETDDASDEGDLYCVLRKSLKMNSGKRKGMVRSA